MPKSLNSPTISGRFQSARRSMSSRVTSRRRTRAGGCMSASSRRRPVRASPLTLPEPWTARWDRRRPSPEPSWWEIILAWGLFTLLGGAQREARRTARNARGDTRPDWESRDLALWRMPLHDAPAATRCARDAGRHARSWRTTRSRFDRTGSRNGCRSRPACTSRSPTMPAAHPDASQRPLAADGRPAPPWDPPRVGMGRSRCFEPSTVRTGSPWTSAAPVRPTAAGRRHGPLRGTRVPLTFPAERAP